MVNYLAGPVDKTISGDNTILGTGYWWTVELLRALRIIPSCTTNHFQPICGSLTGGRCQGALEGGGLCGTYLLLTVAISEEEGYDGG